MLGEWGIGPFDEVHFPLLIQRRGLTCQVEKTSCLFFFVVVVERLDDNSFGLNTTIELVASANFALLFLHTDYGNTD